MREAGLLGHDGVLLGRWQEDYLRHDGPEHVLCFAPTRSGKGVGLVVPTLLTWPGSAIVHDIKSENWTLTAGFRARHGRALLFDPTNSASAAYNTLLEMRRGEWEVRDVQNVADVLVDPEGSLERRNHWEKTSHSLLVGAILHVLYAEADKTLAGVAAFLSDPRRPIEATLQAMMTTPHLGEAGNHRVSIRIYPDRIVVVAEGKIVCEHARIIARSHDQPGRTVYDWRHYLAVIQRKPGALRNGAPFAAMPDAFGRLQQHLLKQPGGDREMVEILALILHHDEQAVLCAVELALTDGAPTKTHILNLLHRLIDGKPVAAPAIETPQGLTLDHEPRADVERYDALREPMQEARHAP